MSDSPKDDEEEAVTESWRRLALQFDQHRMQALWHLRAMVENPRESRASVIEFLNAAPTDGNEVLTQRIAEIAAATEGALPKGWKLLKDTTFDERKWHEDASHENGNYCNTCCHCGREFLGHKRRVSCRACAKPPGEADEQA